ncbi:putative vacuolar membrane protein [Tolypocladium ophioglossoides CBS 100239]|uniref:Putative vacuolar membrane protein n=1 Tax=Tolypocladium ophioglossoides (strain CBS 100239) TaxID=1163406 RepID=A0A0L0N2V4_TOLOC|nr:putative vacuolar membrane protein [Tolypocladium ophioglossoides CBS 100239]
MGCFGQRRKQTQEFTDHQWDYITLADFKAKGCGAGFFYGYLWFSLILSIAVYSVDSFTAVNLLAFNRWSSKIEPAIPISVSKWIFSGCIIASFVNLGFEGIRATRVMKRRNVAECYMDSLAARWESIRVGSGQGWRRFLVFTELTKSKKGAEYIALFTYFSFQSWIRVILCSGPRQVVNAFTLKSVYEAKLAPTATSVDGAILGFFDKIRALGTEDYQQAVILSGMCFTLVIWVFSALYLLSAVFCYVFFLFHYIPRADGGLTGYCERKVNKRLTRIVTNKVNKALAKGQAKRERAEALAMRNGEKPPQDRAATLPTLPDVGGPAKEDSLLEMPVLGRSETTATLPAYSSRPGTPNSFELRVMDQKRPIQFRTGTSGSAASYSSRAPLMGAAADMGYGRASPEPSLPDVDFGAMPPHRPGTSNSQRSYGPRPGYGRMNGNSTSSSLRNPVTASPAPMDTDTMPPFSGPSRMPTPHSINAYGLSNSSSGPPPFTRSYEAFNPDGRSSPAPSVASYRTGTPAARHQGPMGAPSNQPMRSLTGPVSPRGPQYPPQRNMTAPMPPRGSGGDYFDRAGTPQRTGTPQGMRGTPPQRPYGQGQDMPPGQREGPYGYDGDQGGRRY